LEITFSVAVPDRTRCAAAQKIFVGVTVAEVASDLDIDPDTASVSVSLSDVQRIGKRLAHHMAGASEIRLG
jgi:hypothetical protein